MDAIKLMSPTYSNSKEYQELSLKFCYYFSTEYEKNIFIDDEETQVKFHDLVLTKFNYY